MSNSTLPTWLSAVRPRVGQSGTKVHPTRATFVQSTGWQSHGISQFTTTRFGALATVHAESWSRART